MNVLYIYYFATTSRNVEAFVPTMDQFENHVLLELRRLRKEPPSHGPFEFIVRIKLLTAEKHVSKQMEIGGCQFWAV